MKIEEKENTQKNADTVESYTHSMTRRTVQHGDESVLYVKDITTMQQNAQRK